MLKQLLVFGAGAAIGNYIADNFILKQPDGKGFVPVTDGFGMDEVARAATIAVSIFLLHKVL